ncbi:DHA2 family efflux MFS transporter permease subunit [Winogradskya consettensis]|uniref:MFS transporter n=1 Tax=Winogradskya consettensis TaxID=113560 RepID=A0A919T019_9ACTN|nr:DHA2 family efflux MFS transporter permease subunit [Actinoplanes consettensis]GIM82238.1 MFS transporter [Actinoplanes consettensis]
MTDVRVATGRKAWTALGFLAAAQFLVVLSTSIVNIALPQLRDGLHLSPSGLAWVVNAYVLVFGALLLPGGRIADLAGRRRVFLGGLTLFIVAVTVAGVANSGVLLIIARAVQGIAAALVAPAALALVLAAFPPGRERGRALGIWGAVSGAGGAAGVLLGGVLTQLWGWRGIFLATVPLGLAVLLGAARAVRPDKPEPGRRLDVPGTVLLTAGLLSFTYGAGGLPNSGPVVALLGGAVLLAAFVWWQTRATQPLISPTLIKIRDVAVANLTMLLLGAIWIGLFYLLPLYQQQVLHYSPLHAGLTQLPLAVMIMISSSVAPRIALRAGATSTLIGGFAVLAAGLLWLSRTPADADLLLDLVAPTILVGLGLGAVFVQLTGLSANGVPAADSGTAGGLINATRQIGGALGLAALTTLNGYTLPFVIMAALSVIALLVIAASRRHPHERLP